MIAAGLARRTWIFDRGPVETAGAGVRAELLVPTILVLIPALPSSHPQNKRQSGTRALGASLFRSLQQESNNLLSKLNASRSSAAAKPNEVCCRCPGFQKQAVLAHGLRY